MAEPVPHQEVSREESLEAHLALKVIENERSHEELWLALCHLSSFAHRHELQLTSMLRIQKWTMWLVIGSIGLNVVLHLWFR